MVVRQFRQVDVFGSGPYSGNPLAVVHDAEGASDDEMLSFTRWMNLSETAFLLEPSDPAADYRVRIFTPARELPFAGHPTLGSCHAWAEAAGAAGDEIVQECGVGLVRVRRDETGFAFAAPPLLRSGPLEDDLVDRLVDFTGVDPKAVVAGEWVDNGPGWMALMLDSADAVKAVRPDFSRWKGGLDLGLVGPYPEGSECQFEVRALFTDDQGMVREDPVTGSLNASLGQWLFAAGYAEGSYLASQGTSMGRRGRVRVSRDGDDVWVGGATRTVIIGQIEF